MKTANYVIVKVSQQEKKCCRVDRAMCRAHRRQEKHKAAVGGRTKWKNAGQRRANYNQKRLKRQPTTESKAEKPGSVDPKTAIMLLLHIPGEGFSVPSGSETGFHNLPFIPPFLCIVQPIQPATSSSDFLEVWGSRLLCNFVNKLSVIMVSYHIRLLIFNHSLIIHKYILLQWKQYKESFWRGNAHESCHQQLPKSS